MTRPLLLLLPGMLNSEAVFCRLAPLLAALADIRIIDDFRQDDIADMARHAWSFTPADGQVHVAGFSMGGFVALEMLAEQPTRIAGLAMLNSAVDVDGPAEMVIREKTIAAAERDYPKLVERIIDLGLHADHRADASLRAEMRAMAEVVGAAGLIRQTRAVMARRDLGEHLATHRAPLAIIGAQADLVTPLPRSREIAALRPDARLSIIPSAGHMTVLENPTAVAEALGAWLAA